jgi:hypothetical protein
MTIRARLASRKRRGGQGTDVEHDGGLRIVVRWSERGPRWWGGVAQLRRVIALAGECGPGLKAAGDGAHPSEVLLRHQQQREGGGAADQHRPELEQRVAAPELV